MSEHLDERLRTSNLKPKQNTKGTSPEFTASTGTRDKNGPTVWSSDAVLKTFQKTPGRKSSKSQNVAAAAAVETSFPWSGGEALLTILKRVCGGLVGEEEEDWCEAAL